MEDEDKLLCDAWVEIGQDPIRGAEKKGSTYWKRIHDYFHENRRYPPYELESDRNENSLSHRWNHIQTECNMFTGGYDSMQRQPVSGVGMKDLASQALSAHKTMYGKQFLLISRFTNVPNGLNLLQHSTKRPTMEGNRAMTAPQLILRKRLPQLGAVDVWIGPWKKCFQGKLEA